MNAIEFDKYMEEINLSEKEKRDSSVDFDKLIRYLCDKRNEALKEIETAENEEIYHILVGKFLAFEDMVCDASQWLK